MTILELRSENVKRISVVAVKPTPTGLVIIAGRNGQGKTSVLDTIEMVLAGADHIPSKPVRKGQEKAIGDIDLGDFTIKRTITATGGGSLIVRNKDGQKLDSPQKLLDTLFRRLSFEPLEFVRLPKDTRTKVLRELLGLDFSALDAEAKTVYDERTVINRTVKAKEAMLEANKRYPDVPAEEVSIQGVFDEQQKAIAHNEGIAARRRQMQTLTENAMVAREKSFDRLGQIDDLKKQIAAHEKEISVLDAKAKADEEKALDLKKQLEESKEINTSVFAKKISDLELQNNQVRKNKMVDGIVAEFKAATKESEKLTERLVTIDRQKRDALANARFPVEGLGLDTNEVTVNGIPFDQASTAEQLKISVAMGLAMNPKLRVLLVRQGNDLDDDNLKLLAKMAEDAKAQIWLERVSTAGDVSVIIEDGHVAEPKQAVPETKEAKAETKPAQTETLL